MVVTREEALSMFEENKFKAEIINGLPQDATISLYRCGPMVGVILCWLSKECLVSYCKLSCCGPGMVVCLQNGRVVDGVPDSCRSLSFCTPVTVARMPGSACLSS